MHTLNQNPAQATEIQPSVQWLINHFERESAFLDVAIRNCLAIKTLLQSSSQKPRDSREAEAPAETPLDDRFQREPQPPERLPSSAATTEQLAELQNEMSQYFQPVSAGREQLASVMQSVGQSLLPASQPTRKPPRLYDLIGTLDEPARSNLKQLRQQITEKLQKFRAISSANQAVLFYTLEFHSRLLAGYVGRETENESYNAAGRSNRTSSSNQINLIHTNC